MDLINKCQEDLKSLKNCKNIKQRRVLINKCKNCLVNAISEISKNCLKGNIKLSKCKINKLKKYKNVLRLISKRLPLCKRKKLIIQKGGGFLSILIPPALALLTEFLKK